MIAAGAVVTKLCPPDSIIGAFLQFTILEMSKVLVLATSRKTRGGVTSVVCAHEKGAQWERYHCRWIATHRDRCFVVKLAYLFCGLLQYVLLLPFYDMVHIHVSEPVSALRKVPFMVLARLLRRKVIVHFHSFSPETTIRSRYRWVYRYLFCHADVVITLSDFWRKAVSDEFNLYGKVRVIYNPCMAQIRHVGEGHGFADSDIVMPKHHVILYAGTVNARKGYADMIRAFARIAEWHREWMIVFAGNGEIEQGKQLAAELGISSQTLFLGWITGRDKERAFREADIFCLPSYAEGFPMAVLDAWSYGLPVITTPVGGIPDVARNGENMLLFPPGDVDALSVQMERMISDESLREKIAQESLNFACTTFNKDTINRQVELLYAELSGEDKVIESIKNRNGFF